MVTRALVTSSSVTYKCSGVGFQIVWGWPDSAPPLIESPHYFKECRGKPCWVHLNCAIATSEVGYKQNNFQNMYSFWQQFLAKERQVFQMWLTEIRSNHTFFFFPQSAWYFTCKPSQNLGLFYSGDPWIVIILLVLLLFVCGSNEWDASALSFSSSSDLDGDWGTNLKLVEIKKNPHRFPAGHQVSWVIKFHSACSLTEIRFSSS